MDARNNNPARIPAALVVAELQKAAQSGTVKFAGFGRPLELLAGYIEQRELELQQLRQRIAAIEARK